MHTMMFLPLHSPSWHVVSCFTALQLACCLPVLSAWIQKKRALRLCIFIKYQNPFEPHDSHISLAKKICMEKKLQPKMQKNTKEDMVFCVCIVPVM